MQERSLPRSNNKNKTSLILYTFDEYSLHLKNVIDSFDDIIDTVYILCFDVMSIKNLSESTHNIIYVCMKDYKYNINYAFNQICKENTKDIWILWQPTYLLNEHKKKEFQKLITDIRTDKYNMQFIYGLSLFIDVKNVEKDNMYSNKNGGCLIADSTVKLLEDKSLYTVDKTNLKINYNLYKDNEHYFFNFALALHKSYILIKLFHNEYLDYLQKVKFLTFADWYKMVKAKLYVNGQVYAERDIISRSKNMIPHGIPLTPGLEAIDLYEFNGTKRTKKLFGSYHDHKMTIVTLVRNNKHYLKESMDSLLKQTSDDWNCVIVNDGSFDEIKIEDFIDVDSPEGSMKKDKFTIVNIKDWNGLVKCHKTALLHATNDVIGILDVDDKLELTAVEDILNVYNKTPEDNIYVYSNFYYCDAELNKLRQGYARDVKTCLLNDRCANHFRTFKLKYYYLTDGYDNDLQFGAEDQDILIKMETVCTPVYLDKCLYMYRTYGANTTSISSLKMMSTWSLFISIFKNVLDRYGDLTFQLKIFSNISDIEYGRYLEDNLSESNKGFVVKDGVIELIQGRVLPIQNLADVDESSIVYYCGVYSNEIFIGNAMNPIFRLENKLIQYVDRYTKEYKNNQHNKFGEYKLNNVKLNWDRKDSKFFIDDEDLDLTQTKSNQFDLDRFRKIHPNVYFDNIYIINLKKDVDKRNRMDLIFNKLDIKHEFFDAVLGKDEKNMIQYVENNYEKTLKSPGAYGYSLSMINIFKDALEKRYKKILVCDDDIIFHKDFLNMFDKNIRDIPFDWKVLFFGLSGPWTHPFINQDFKNYTYKSGIIKDTTNCDGSYCVGYDINIFETLIDVTSKFDYPFDTAMMKHFIANPTIIKYSFNPYLVIADTTKSDITDRETNILDNFSAYQFKYRQNLKTFDIDSMMHKQYNTIIKNPYPLVSIIMTVFNKSIYLVNAIESMLRQTYKNIELVIVEDVSTDDSRDILKRYEGVPNVKIIYNEENMGCYKSRNTGIRNASGSIIGFQDADDYAMSNKIEKQIKLMNKHNLMMVGTNMLRSELPDINFESDSEILTRLQEITPQTHNASTEFFGYPTLLIKKELFDKHGLYIERRKGMDMEFPERVMFKELGVVFDDSSWEFLDKGENSIYKKIDEILVISPMMNELNITNSITSDDFLTNYEWRKNYVK